MDKSVWEKVSKYKIKVEISPLDINPPRERDRWFMRAVEEAGITDTNELSRINQVRLHQQVLYVSDLLEANGKTIDKRYLVPWSPDDNWSRLIFPKEKPPQRDFALWWEVVQSLAPRGRIQHRIGNFTSHGHKIWPWRYEVDQNVLLYLRGETMDVYSPAIGPEYDQRPNCWMISSQDVPAEDIGKICSIREARNQGMVNVTSHSPQCAPKIPPRDFWAVIEEWGELWIWENLKVVGDPGWLEALIAESSCLEVTDGSYMKQMYPNISSAAFIFECSRGRGRIIGYLWSTRRMLGATEGSCWV